MDQKILHYSYVIPSTIEKFVYLMVTYKLLIYKTHGSHIFNKKMKYLENISVYQLATKVTLLLYDHSKQIWAII